MKPKYVSLNNQLYRHSEPVPEAHPSSFVGNFVGKVQETSRASTESRRKFPTKDIVGEASNLPLRTTPKPQSPARFDQSPTCAKFKAARPKSGPPLFQLPTEWSHHGLRQDRGPSMCFRSDHLVALRPRPVRRQLDKQEIEPGLGKGSDTLATTYGGAIEFCRHGANQMK
jgi:hypothetical protein